MTNNPDDINEQLAALKSRVAALEQQLAITNRSRYVTSRPLLGDITPGRFAPFSTCNTGDFLHPRFSEICGLIKHPFQWHRKLWEWVYVVHQLLASGAVVPGSKGLVFGVGHERLPALFASMGATIVATDAPDHISEATGWKASAGQYSESLKDIRYTDIVDGDVFDANVSFQTCDMNHIGPELSGFDFNWSSCCFEHLGSIEAGLQFIVNAVENTLRVGGFAVHTTEFNLSSDTDTVDHEGTIIFRQRDLLELIRRLESRGHLVQPLVVAPDSHYWDFYVDVPPYTHTPHLKLMLGNFVSTSEGIVVQRGR